MGLEAASYISQLDTANPGGSDAYSTADDHLRLIKAVLKTQFPNLGAAAVSPTAAELNVLAGSTGAVERQANKNAASGYAGLDASSRLAKAQQHAQTAYLDAAMFFTGSEIRITNIAPILMFAQTDGATNEKNYGWVVDDTAISLRFYDDAFSGYTVPLYIGRIGTTVGAVALAGTGLTFNGTNVMLTNTAVTNAQVPQSAVTQHQAALSIAFTQLTGSISNAQVPVGAVTQHQGSLSIAWSQVTGVPSSTGTGANTLALRDANGYLFAAYLNQSSSNGENPTISQFIVNNGADGFLRKASLAHVASSIQSSLSIAWSQLFNVPGSFTPSAHNQDASTINSGTFADARIALSNVSQHAGSIKTRNHGSKAGTTVTLSTADPSGGTDGDLWYKY